MPTTVATEDTSARPLLAAFRRNAAFAVLRCLRANPHSELARWRAKTSALAPTARDSAHWDDLCAAAVVVPRTAELEVLCTAVQELPNNFEFAHLLVCMLGRCAAVAAALGDQ